ncbi:MAG: hypothetical protein U0556_03720 [Dehalococcoidia bacterium]
MTNDSISLRQDLDKIAERHGPLEVAVIMAPEEFLAEKGIRRSAGGWAVELGVVATRGVRRDDSIEQIGDLTLVLTEQTANALHSFLTGLLDPGSRKRRSPVENLLPMVDPPKD